jgi:hypothetical protein
MQIVGSYCPQIISRKDMRSCSRSQRDIYLQTQGIIVWPKVTRQITRCVIHGKPKFLEK